MEEYRRWDDGELTEEIQRKGPTELAAIITSHVKGQTIQRLDHVTRKGENETVVVKTEWKLREKMPRVRPGINVDWRDKKGFKKFERENRKEAVQKRDK